MATAKIRKRSEPVARRLRKDSTDAEMLFWQKVRSRQLQGYRFKRQCPIDGYIVDFICPELMLVVEIDGGQHAESQRDVVRDRRIHDKGLKVLRFWNNDVLNNIEGVLTALGEQMGSLSSAREAGGGRGRGVRGRSRNPADGCCGATPSSQPSPATRLRRAEEKGQGGEENA